MQSAAGVACRQLGFDGGAFGDARSVPANGTLLPAWVGRIQCNGSEPAITECEPLNYGDTETCGGIQSLTCTAAAGGGTAGGGTTSVAALPSRFCLASLPHPNLSYIHVLFVGNRFMQGSVRCVEVRAGAAIVPISYVQVEYKSVTAI